ncbi:MAG: M56 family metallopeptidase [Clostridia bacterium]|nr:M56 family metallopeptidase [Clostridia bacterium]
MIRFLVQLLGLSIVLTAITLILMAFKGVMRKKITAYCRYMLWLIVILRMCVPISIAVLPPLINVSVSEQFQNEVNPDLSNGKNNAFSEETVSSVNNIAPEVNTNKTDNADTTILPSATNSLNVNGTVNRPVEPSENAGRLNEGTDKRGFTVSLKRVVYSAFCIWLLGTVFCLFVELKDYSSFLKELKGSAVKAEGNIQALYDSLCESFEIKNAPKLFVLKDVTSPMLVGYIRPVIVLPEITLDDSAWEGVILHELTHYKRKDLWVKLCAVVAKSIHWFNPAAHIAVQLLNEEMELSCDEKTLYGMNEERRVQYGDVMIKILKNCKNKQNAFSTHFNPSVKTAKGRILNILDSSKKKRGISLIVFCLFVCLLAGTVFGCTKVDSNKNTGEETQKINVTNNPDKIYHVISWEREKSTLETIEGFDIDESWKKMAKAFLTKDVATIEELAGVKKGMYEKFKNFEFGDFYVNLDPNNKYLFISVFIKDAKGVEVKSGDYASFMVGQGVNGVSLSIPHLHGGRIF